MMGGVAPPYIVCDHHNIDHLFRCVAVTSLCLVPTSLALLRGLTEYFSTIRLARYTLFLHSPIYRLPSKDIFLLHRINCNSRGYYLRFAIPSVSVYKLQHLFLCCNRAISSNHLSLNIQQLGILPNIVTLLPPF